MSNALKLMVLACMVILVSGCDLLDQFKPEEQIYKPLNVTNTTPEVRNSSFDHLEIQGFGENEFLKPYYGNLTFYFLPLEGTPVLIVFPDNQTALINTGDGSQTSSLFNYVKNLGYREIDYVFLSNYNPYRMGGTPYVSRRFNPSVVYDRGGAINTRLFSDYYDTVENRKSIGSTRTIDINGTTVTMIPSFQTSDKTNNEDIKTLAFKFEYKDFTFLHLGDCIDTCEVDIPTKDLRAQVIVAGKNGACGGTSMYLLKQINPDYIIFDNSYGEPCEDASDVLEYLDMKVIKMELKPLHIMTDGEVI